MGSGRWDPKAYRAFSSASATMSTDEIYTTSAKAARVARGLSASDVLSPKGVKVRESRDSADNPTSNAIIVALDVTGSMGMIADVLARTGLGTLFEEILTRKPVPDPHLMFMAVGDANYDRAPLQVSQFEADKRIIDQLTEIYVEGGGGGNSFESYNLPWYFAAMHTSIDCFEKRGKKGYLFTVGDENAPGSLTAAQIEAIIGDKPERALSNEEILAMASRTYEIFHVIVEEGSHARSAPEQVLSSWSRVLGQRVLRLSDHTKLSEVIVSAIEVNEGRDKEDVAKSWGGETALVVRKAITDIAAKGAAGGVVRP